MSTLSSSEASTNQLRSIAAADCFNVCARKQFNTRKLTFGWRDYYRWPALVFSNPPIPWFQGPYSWFIQLSFEFIPMGAQHPSQARVPRLRAR